MMLLELALLSATGPDHRVKVSTGPVTGFKALFGHDGAVIGVHAAVTKLDAYIITEPFGGKYPQLAVLIQFARTSVHDATIESHAVTRLHVPTNNSEALRIRIDIRES